LTEIKREKSSQRQKEREKRAYIDKNKERQELTETEIKRDKSLHRQEYRETGVYRDRNKERQELT